MLACGLDFGTSNTALCLVQDGRAVPLQLDPEHDPPLTIPTVTWFSPEHRRHHGSPAVREYLASELAGRFIQSVKRHLPSRAFSHTRILGQAMDLPELIAGFLEHLRLVAERHAGRPVTRVLMGRPAVFHADPERDRLAERRLERAAAMAGFEEVRFQLEPIAAARAFEQELDHEVLCLVGDLGGGTSDFTLMRLGPERGGDRRQDVLGSAGVPIAGNDLDAAIVRALVLPWLGHNTTWRPIGRPVPIPSRLHLAMTSWHALSFAGNPDALDEIERWRRTAADPEGLGRLIQILKWNLGFELFLAVERCKVALSGAERAPLDFVAHRLDLHEELTRTRFEEGIAPLLRRMAGCVDGLLARAGDPEVSAVFLTGGSSLVPAVRAIFEERFPGRLLGRNVFTSVGAGLGVEAAEIWPT